MLTPSCLVVLVLVLVLNRADAAKYKCTRSYATLSERNLRQLSFLFFCFLLLTHLPSLHYPTPALLGTCTYKRTSVFWIGCQCDEWGTIQDLKSKCFTFVLCVLNLLLNEYARTLRAHSSRQASKHGRLLQFRIARHLRHWFAPPSPGF